MVNVVTKWKMTGGTSHRAQDLLDSMKQAGGPLNWTENVVGNLKPGHTMPRVRLKAELINRTSQLLVAIGMSAAPARHN